MSSNEWKSGKLFEGKADRRQVLKITIAGAATLLLRGKWIVPTVHATAAPSTGAASAPATTCAVFGGTTDAFCAAAAST